MDYPFTNFLPIDHNKTYHLEEKRIISTEKFQGDIITKIYLETDDQVLLKKIWAEFFKIFHAGKKAKMEEIKSVLEIR